MSVETSGGALSRQEEREPAEASGPAPNRMGARLAAGVLFGVVVYVGFVLWADAGGIAEALREFRWSVVLYACGLSFANYLVRFVRWQRYLHLLGIRLAPGLSFTIHLAGLALTVTPGKMGETFKSWLIRRVDGTPIHRSAPIVLAERFTDLLGFLVLFAVGGLASGIAREYDWILWATLALCAVLLTLASSERLGRGSIALLTGLPGLGRLRSKLEGSFESTRVLLAPRELLLPTLLATFGWGLECAGFWLVSREFAPGALDFASATATYAVAAVAGAVLVIFPGGLGVTEASMGGLLEARYRAVAGVGLETARAKAASCVLITRLCTLWFAVLVGLVATAVFRRRAAAGLTPATGRD